MSAYQIMNRLIANLNRQYDEGRINEAKYQTTANTYRTRLKVFYGCGDLTDEEYPELIAKLKTFEEA